MKFFSNLIASLCLSIFLVSNYVAAQASSEVSLLKYKVIAERTHKTGLFTQGLELHQGQFFESSGLYNKSFFATYPETEPESTWAKLSAPFTKKINLDDKYFAEGMTIWNKKIYVMTWKEQKLFIYSADDFKFITTLSYEGEGWGLTHDNQFLIRSDGSDKLFLHQPSDFHLVKTISVTLNQKPVFSLNELEYAEGFIYANIWQDNRIVKIDANSGKVVGVLDLSSLANSMHLSDTNSVLNGIAYDEKHKGFWVTGKQWPKMFLIQFQ